MSEIPADILATAASLATDVAAEGTFVGLQKKFAEALMAERCATMELAITRAIKAWPRAHTYASENADAYRSQDLVRDRIVKSLEDYLAFARRSQPGTSKGTA